MDIDLTPQLNGVLDIDNQVNAPLVTRGFDGSLVNPVLVSPVSIFSPHNGPFP